MQLEYEPAYHLHCKLVLRSGRTITLETLHQETTYAGLLVGTPSRESNDWAIENALRAAQERCAGGAKPHLIPPPRRDCLREPGDMRELRSPRHVPEWLPMVRCIASFKDVDTVRDHDKDLSVLTVVWYQDEFALPILEPALSQLRALSWEALAVDVEL